MPCSTKGTSAGQAWLTTSTNGDSSFSAAVYAPLLIVPTVPITPTRPVLVALIAARAPGWITPITGMDTLAEI
ncbi:hypothetical protein D3C71_2086150 [compost metagenome]